MSVSVKMPLLGESVTEGTVTRWLKREGDEVATDEPLVEVSTDKVDTEIPSPSAGILLRILAQEDETVAVGAELAVIGAANEAPLQPAKGAANGDTAEVAPQREAQPEPEPAAAEVVPEAPEAPEAQPGSQHDSPEPGTNQSPPAVPGGVNAVSTSVVLPALGESVTEGTVTRWLKDVGDAVAADEPLVEVSTDKVDTEIPAPLAGVLTAITVGVDQTVDVGGELGVISATAAAEPTPTPPAPSAAASQPPRPAPSAAPPQPAPPAPSPASPVAPQPAPQPTTSSAPASAPAAETGYVTPLVRKLAADYGVDLAGLTGTGVGGRIRKQDVLEAAKTSSRTSPAVQALTTPGLSAAGPGPSPLRGRTEKMSRLRRVIAERMVDSLHISAQLTTVVEVDVSRIAALRQRAKAEFEAREGVKLSFLPFFAKATVEALKTYPMLNASIDTENASVTYHDAEHLGMAVDTERGLLVPVIHQAGDLNIAGLARRIADLAARTRDNKITPDELSGGTFTLTNTGSRGALFDTPIINQPQVGILGTGAVVKRPVVVSDVTGNDVIAIRSMVLLALTYDHRLVDGADAARFLGSLKTRLDDGAFEADLGL